MEPGQPGRRSAPPPGHQAPVPALAYPRPGHQAASAFAVPPSPSARASATVPPPGAPESGPPQRGGRTAMLVLATLLAVSVVIGGMAVALYLDERGSSSQIARYEDEIASLRRERDQAQRQLAEAQADLERLRGEHDALGACVDAMAAWFLAGSSEADLVQVQRLCADAGRTLDPSPRPAP